MANQFWNEYAEYGDKNELDVPELKNNPAFPEPSNRDQERFIEKMIRKDKESERSGL